MKRSTRLSGRLRAGRIALATAAASDIPRLRWTTQSPERRRQSSPQTFSE